MGKDIDTSSSHYKGHFSDIYAVERKYPNGGIDGDFVEIEGWAHYWNAERSTWCVNAGRDSYWDELITNMTDVVSKIRGASFMGIANDATIPETIDGAKMFYIAKEEGTYSNFGSGLKVYDGISIIYTIGEYWSVHNLMRIEQNLGNSPDLIMSQKAVTEALDNLANSIATSGFVLYMSSSMGWSWRIYQLRAFNSDGSYKAFTKLSVQARYNGLDVTSKLQNVVWERDSGNQEADAVWNKTHENIGLSLSLTYEDLGEDSYRIGQVFFTCTAEYKTRTETKMNSYYLQF